MVTSHRVIVFGSIYGKELKSISSYAGGGSSSSFSWIIFGFSIPEWRITCGCSEIDLKGWLVMTESLEVGWFEGTEERGLLPLPWEMRDACGRRTRLFLVLDDVDENCLEAGTDGFRDTWRDVDPLPGCGMSLKVGGTLSDGNNLQSSDLK